MLEDRGVRLAAPVRTLVAKNCKALAAVWIEVRRRRRRRRRRGARGESVEKPVDQVDLRNCSSLERLVGASRGDGGRLTVDLRGCTSPPPSARPPMHR